MCEDGVEQNDASHPSDGFNYTVPKQEAEGIPSWAEDYEADDTIRWRASHVDGVQESPVLGFSTAGLLAYPVIPATDVSEDAAEDESVRVERRNWVPDSADCVAEIEIEYHQTMRVSIPAEEMPADESSALELVKNVDPEFVADALPNSWDQAVSDGEFEVVSLSEEDDLR